MFAEDGDIRHHERQFGPNFIVDPSVYQSPTPLADVYWLRLKRRRVCAAADSLIVQGYEKDDGSNWPIRQRSSLDALPDECLFEILRRVAGRRERSISACVSKRWLMLLGTFCSSDEPPAPRLNHQLDLSERADDDAVKVEGSADENGRRPRRSFEGDGATDVRLVAMAIGAGSCEELLIRGSKTSRRVTDAGLTAVARGFPSLRVLSLWDCPSVSDEGLVQIAGGCPLLEKLDLCKCPQISDLGIAAIARKCQKLSTLTIESCQGIGDEGLQAIGRSCPNLRSISVVDCLLVGDQGVAGLVSSPYSSTMQKIKLQRLNISDASLAVVGLHGTSVTELVLAGLRNVTERGFWVMASAGALRTLSSLTVASCDGLTDLSLEAAAKGCPLLKHICLRRCFRLSDAGLKAFAAAAGSLENLQLEDCRRLSLCGVLDAVVSCRSSDKLRALSLAGCMGVKDDDGSRPESLSPPSYPSLRFLSIRHCRGFGDSGLATVGKLCPQLRHVELCGNAEVTERGLRTLIEDSGLDLVTVNLSGCVNLTDDAVTALARRHGGSLRVLNLEGCAKVTDKSLSAIADFCTVLQDLDVSGSAVTDKGVASLASSAALDLQVLSLSGCPKISERSVPHLSNLGQSLVGLGLQQCSSIGSHAMAALQHKMWWCDILC